jgi:predicted patatin/cPLA2 family phospholipase
VTQLHGVNPQAVIDLLKDRAGRGERTDGRKLALLVEGGGMRGVCSAGGLVALDALGLKFAFDQIYATSAGAMNVAYMLSGQAVFGIQIYYKEINNSRFINYWRLPKVVDVDYIFDQVVTRIRPLQTKTILEAPCKFYISVFDKDRAITEVLNAADFPDEILALLKATTALPVVYNRAVRIGARRFIDGGLSCPVPLEHAIQNGCTDLLVFLTRPASYESPEPEWWERQLFSLMCSRGNAALRRVFDHSHHDSNQCRKACLGLIPTPRPVNIATFCPAESEGALTRLTKDPQILKDSAVAMALRTLHEFGGSPDLVDDLIQT